VKSGWERGVKLSCQQWNPNALFRSTRKSRDHLGAKADRPPVINFCKLSILLSVHCINPISMMPMDEIFHDNYFLRTEKCLQFNQQSLFYCVQKSNLFYPSPVCCIVKLCHFSAKRISLSAPPGLFVIFNIVEMLSGRRGEEFISPLHHVYLVSKGVYSGKEI
jgi:hypothetical protein